MQDENSDDDEEKKKVKAIFPNSTVAAVHIGFHGA